MGILTTQTFNCLSTVYAGAIFCYCCIKLLYSHTHAKYWDLLLNRLRNAKTQFILKLSPTQPGIHHHRADLKRVTLTLTLILV